MGFLLFEAEHVCDLVSPEAHFKPQLPQLRLLRRPPRRLLRLLLSNVRSVPPVGFFAPLSDVCRVVILLRYELAKDLS